MRNIHRVGLATASIVATLAVAGAFVVDGYTSARGSLVAQTPATASPTHNAPPPAPQTIYVMPVATPAHITITRADPVTTPPVTHIIVAAPGGGDDSGGDSGGGDR